MLELPNCFTTRAAGQLKEEGTLNKKAGVHGHTYFCQIPAVPQVRAAEMEQVTFTCWANLIWGLTLRKSLHPSVPQCPICKKGITALKHEQPDYSYRNGTKKNIILKKYPGAAVMFPTSAPSSPRFALPSVMPTVERC